MKNVKLSSKQTQGECALLIFVQIDQNRPAFSQRLVHTNSAKSFGKFWQEKKDNMRKLGESVLTKLCSIKQTVKPFTALLL